MLPVSERATPVFIIMVYSHITCISYRFEVIRILFMTGNCPFRPILGVFRVKHPQLLQLQNYHPKGSSIHQTASFELLCAKIGSRVWAVALLKNKKNKQVTGPA